MVWFCSLCMFFVFLCILRRYFARYLFHYIYLYLILWLLSLLNHVLYSVGPASLKYTIPFSYKKSLVCIEMTKNCGCEVWVWFSKADHFSFVLITQVRLELCVFHGTFYGAHASGWVSSGSTDETNHNRTYTLSRTGKSFIVLITIIHNAMTHYFYDCNIFTESKSFWEYSNVSLIYTGLTTTVQLTNFCKPGDWLFKFMYPDKHLCTSPRVGIT